MKAFRKLLGPFLALTLLGGNAYAAPAVAVGVGLSGARTPYKGATYALDFAHGYYRIAGVRKSSLSSVSGWSYSGGCAGCTATDAQGVVHSFVVNTPRITNQGLLVEGAATNLLSYSQGAFSNGAWQTTNSTISDNTVVAPDGTTTASAITSTASDATVHQNPTPTSGTTYTGTIWLKVPSGTLTTNVYLFGGGVSATAKSVTLTTSWQRVTLPTLTTTSTASAVFQVGGGNTFSTGNVIHFWGAQLETGSFASSYIPTTSAAVTRAADVAKVTGITGSATGTIAARFGPSGLNSSGSYGAVAYNDGSASNNIDLRATGASYLASGGSNVATQTTAYITVPLAVQHFAATSFSPSSVAFSVDGATKSTVTPSASPPSAQNQLQFGGLGGGTTYPLNGYLSHVSLYPTALTGSALQSPSL